MEQSSVPTILDAKIKRVAFSFATADDIKKASISQCPISHASQLSNPFLGLPLEVGKCESCGTGELGQCEGHFGYIELPAEIYHPDHVKELKSLLSLVCLKCLKVKNRKAINNGMMETILSTCCEEASQISIHECTDSEGVSSLELRIPPKSRPRDGMWTFLERYGFRYGNGSSRPLLPSEVQAMFNKFPAATKRQLRAKKFFPQDGYIIKYLPVPPNCLSVPDVSDGISTMSTDYSVTLLKKVLREAEIIRTSRHDVTNFVSQEIESNRLQAAVKQYFEYRGTGKASRDVDSRFGLKKEETISSTKAWLEKMKTLFIRKGSGFSSRSVITGDAFKGVSEIGLPFEIALKITFEERVNEHNLQFLQKLVDEKKCLTYSDGSNMFSLKEGSKGHTFLRPGQVVHRRIMDGDIVFINRPPTTHKHSLQALRVYVHDDHTVKINPLICGPLSADFDGDCIHLFYPQSLEAKAEVVELFSVEKQLLSSHTGNFNLQLTCDSLLSLKILFERNTLNTAKAQQLAMFVPVEMVKSELLKTKSGPLWTASHIFQATLPRSFDCSGERHTITNSKISKLEFEWDVMTPIVNDIVTSLFFMKGPDEVINFFNSVQPLLMENLYSEGFSVSLRDFSVPRDLLASIQANIKKGIPRDKYLHNVKVPVTNFIKASALGHLIDSKSESALNKVVQQVGFLGPQIAEKGKFYTADLVKEMESLFLKKYLSSDRNSREEFGMVVTPLFQGLDPYQEMVHSVSSREVIVRSSRGLTEPGTLFKNLMAILRDVVICHDGTVRNMCSNSILQFEYGVNSLNNPNEFCAGEPVGVLAATAMSNPAYKAVLDSSPSSNNSWEMMKEILLCGASFKNVVSDRRVILYLKNCDCGRPLCEENCAFRVCNQLKKMTLKDTATEFLIEYRSPEMHENYDSFEGVVGHIHLDRKELMKSNIKMLDILAKCEDTISMHQKKKKIGNLFKRVNLSSSDCCAFPRAKSDSGNFPCIQFLCQGAPDALLDKTSNFLSDTVCPALLQTVIKGDPRVSTANVIWISPDTATWIRSPSKKPMGELAIDVTLEKEAVRKSGDAWRIVMDSCLPIVHLIDTQRSIPYAIKQVQDLLGISCTFEQAVQRLSTSVTMVTKGVLKEHLLLLGNSMTCAGTLIGFNSGGIKAISKALNVQVPFMDATLFTPRRCFERAAEKCHTDNLTSVVASCAWGKHVSVGTGSPFEILWDTRKAELSAQNEIDVFSFLHLLSGSSSLGGMGTSCLGEESDLDADEEFGMDMSPEREAGQDKPMFEDGDDFSLRSSDNNGFAMEAAKETLNSWSSFGTKVDSGENNWAKATENSNWGNKADTGGDGWSKAAESSWGQKDNSKGNAWSTEAGKSTWGDKPGTEQNNQVKVTDTGSWGKKVVTGEDSSNESSGWGKTVFKETKEITETGSWGKKVVTDDYPKETEESCWGKAVDKRTDWSKETEKSTWGVKIGNEQNHSAKDTSNGSWDKKVVTGVDSFKETNESAWGKKVDNKGNEWPEEGGKSSWGASAQKANDSSWGKKGGEPEESGSWGIKSAGLGVQTEQDQVGTNTGGDNNSWEAKAANPSSTWGASSDWGKVGSVSPTGEKKDVWNSSKVWVSQKNDNGGAKDDWSDGRGRGQGRGRGRGRGGRGRESFRDRGPDGEWKNDRIYTPRPANDSNVPSIHTLTGHRLDLFSVELQDVLLETESVIKNIRRIMPGKEQTEYTLGNPLPEEDQKYIIDNVLNYHPDKAAKMGAGLDYIMVDKHREFQDTRCFYAVSVDGNKEDFSYRKCLENFVRQKFPDKADEFIPIYFAKRQPRPAWNRDRGPGRDEAGTPRTPAQDDAGGTPRWKSGGTTGWKDDTPTQEDAGTAGWKSSGWKSAGPAADGAGWGGSSTPVQDDANSTLGKITGWESGTSTQENAGATPAQDDANSTLGKNTGWESGTSTQENAGTTPSGAGWGSGNTEKQDLTATGGWN